MRMDQTQQEMIGQPVRSLQYMLRRLGKKYPFLPALAVDGIFGEETLEAVMLFQRELAPPVTGVVDWRTWQAIRNKWLAAEEAMEPARVLRAFPGEGVRVEPGETAAYMALPQAMFQLLSRHLNGIVPGRADGIHGTVSAANVRWLQKAGGVAQTGVMDSRTWGLLSRLYELFVVQELDSARQKRQGEKQFTGGWG